MRRARAREKKAYEERGACAFAVCEPVVSARALPFAVMNYMYGVLYCTGTRVSPPRVLVRYETHSMYYT